MAVGIVVAGAGALVAGAVVFQGTKLAWRAGKKWLTQKD
jgi:hypothetical protein